MVPDKNLVKGEIKILLWQTKTLCRDKGSLARPVNCPNTFSPGKSVYGPRNDMLVIHNARKHPHIREWMPGEWLSNPCVIGFSV